MYSIKMSKSVSTRHELVLSYKNDLVLPVQIFSATIARWREYFKRLYENRDQYYFVKYIKLICICMHLKQI